MAKVILINSRRLNGSKNRIQDLCRLCLLQNREFDLNSVSALHNKKLIDMLACVTNDDCEKIYKREYPQGICEECCSKLELLYKFKQKVAASLNILKIIFKSSVNVNSNEETWCATENEGAVECPSDDDYMNIIDDLTEEVSNYDIDNPTDEVQIQNENSLHEKFNSENYLTEKEPSHNTSKLVCYLEINEQNHNLFDDNAINFKEEQELLNNDLDENLFRNSISPEIEAVNTNRKKAKNIQCDICGAKFTRNSSLRQHNTVHSMEKKFECNLCNKKFTRRAHVDIHMLIHSNIRPHSCEICGRAFTKSGDLKRHQKIHSDVYEFVCLICNKEFKRKEYLATHVNSHYGFKPHKCKYCEKCYQSLSGLLKHTKNVHPQKINS